MDRRAFFVAGGSALVLTACMGPGSNNMTVTVQGTPGMNPGPDGQDRPVTVSILQMTSSAAFDSADYVALQSPSAALGSDLLKADQIVLSGAGPVTRVIPVQSGAAVIGVVGGFISPSGKAVRQKIAAPSSDSGLIINVGPSGISASAA